MLPVCTTATLQPTWSQCYDGSRREAVPCEAVPEEALLRKHTRSPRARYYVAIPLLWLALGMSGASPRPAAGRTVPIAGNQLGELIFEPLPPRVGERQVIRVGADAQLIGSAGLRRGDSERQRRTPCPPGKSETAVNFSGVPAKAGTHPGNPTSI